MQIEPASLEEVRHYMQEKSRMYTMRAWRVCEDGVTLAVFTVSIGGKIPEVSLVIDKKRMSNPHKIYRAALRCMDMLREKGYNNLAAVVAKDNEAGQRFAERLGFVPVDENSKGVIYGA